MQHRQLTPNPQSAHFYDVSGDWKSPHPGTHFALKLPSVSNPDPRLTPVGDRPSGNMHPHESAAAGGYTAYQDPSILYRLMPQ